jgi:hypothetical protein
LNETFQLALNYADIGWPVMPIRKGEKTPATLHGVNDATTDHDRIAKWFDNELGYGIGIACGEESFVVVDIDPRNGGDVEWAELMHEHHGLGNGHQLHAYSGGGGAHFFFKYTDGVKNGAIGEGIDIKSNGGYIIVAPTVHPDTGDEYQWVGGQGPWDGGQLDPPPEWLEEMLPHRKAPGEAITGGMSDDPNDDRPGSVFNRTATWEEILEPHGWRKHDTDGQETRWTRPDKFGGISATTGWEGLDILYVFTSSTEFEPEASYNKFAAYSVLNHDGDYSEAASEIAEVVGTKRPSTFERPTGGDLVYTFRTALPEDHIVSRYMTWCEKQTDAPREYHEAAGLAILSLMTSKVKGRLATYPGGLKTNLYILLTGETTRSRKSTSQKLAMSLVHEVYPVAPLPARSTMEALISTLSEKDNLPTIWAPDELGIKLGEIYQRDFLRGLEELMLTLYDCEPYRYVKVDSIISIEHPHLNILGAATPESLAMAGPGAMVGGLIPRFAIVLPPGLPEPRVAQEFVDLSSEKAELVREFKRVLSWEKGNKAIDFDPAALAVLGNAEMALHGGGASVARLATMLYKVAMLVSCGRMSVRVEESDAQAAVSIVRRWTEGSRRLQPFLKRKAADLEFESRAMGALSLLKSLGEGEHHRAEIAARLKLQKRMLDSIESALVDWGFISLNVSIKTGKFWKVRNDG